MSNKKCKAFCYNQDNEKYNKLIRDKIPEIIKERGAKFSVHHADDKEYLQKLKEKLEEEVQEFLESEETEELADILEVIYALAKTKGVDKDGLEKIRMQKEKERGGFDEK